jgi:RNA polymerase sigma-70 factor (ECF subfamily)
VASDSQSGRAGDGPVGISDETLAIQTQGGDLAAFETLARRYENRLYSYAVRITGDTHEAADQAQEILIRAYESIGRFDPQYRFANWIYGIAAHVCRDGLRKRRRSREQQSEAIELAESPLRVGEEVAAAEEREQVRAAVRRLPLKYREVIVLHYLEEMPYDEVAAALGIKPAAARRRALRAREMLRRYLGGDQGSREATS